MRYFYDYEFIEDGKSIQPISVGMVCEDGREFYAVFNDFDTKAVAKNDWLMENVMTSIKHARVIEFVHDGAPALRNIILSEPSFPKKHIAIMLADFIKPGAELFGWYSSYDHVCLAQTFGKMIDLPKHIPMYTNDIKTLVKQAGNPQMPRQPEGLHNALADARWTKVRYDYVTQLMANG